MSTKEKLEVLSPLSVRVGANTKELLRRHAASLSQKRGRLVTPSRAARELLEQALRSQETSSSDRLIDEAIVSAFFSRKVLELSLSDRPELRDRILTYCRQQVAKHRIEE